MDLKYGSPARDAFVTNVGLITSNGPHGHNIMSAEWTAQVSYDVVHTLEVPGRIIFTGKARSIDAEPMRKPLLYHGGKYWSVGAQLPKPSDDERSAMVKNAESFKK